ncbi:MAG: carbohydrate kinase family protein [Candidatus Velamenicoccus archaeovorus]
MAASFDLLVLGDVNPDLILHGDVVPRFGQAERLVDDAALVLGGSGAITACGAAKLGLRVAVVGVVGDDLFGRFAVETLTQRGVYTDGVVVDHERPTGLSVVLVRGDDRATLTSSGTIADLRADMVDPALLGETRHVHVSSYYLQTALRPDVPALFRAAHDGGATTSIDPNWDPEGSWDGGLLETLRSTDLFLPNRTEACAITGASDVDRAAEDLARRGPTVAVKDGHRGALAVDGGRSCRAEAIPSDVVDATGAGDSFDAGFIAGHLHGWPLERCLRLAVACGSLSTLAPGGTAAQPSLVEALAALDAMPG